MSPAKTKKPARKPRGKSGATKRAVDVRMYNVGFGDAFLLRFPAADRPRTVLVDCGVHPSGPGPRKMNEVVREIIGDVRVGGTDGTPRIDVVVCTHRHADHVSGFRDEAWKDVEVGEVWMPWTENPADPEARRILETQSKTAKKLVSLRGVSAAARALADNALSNAAAMTTLHRGFSGSPRRRFLPREGGRTVLEPKLLPGVKVHVLGPSRDPEVIRDMDPVEGQTYLQLVALREEEAHRGERVSPFRAHWSIGAAEFRRRSGTALSAGDLKAIAAYGELDALAVAVSLEKAVNGTSLMLLFEMGDAHLLFPGDAQWGTWDRALKREASRDALARTSFLKVGHHGSHNATPKEFVEEVAARGLRSMVSTRAGTKNWDIPREPLLRALRANAGRAVRSDRADVADPPGFRRTRAGAATHTVDVSIPI